jgi:hypothetical protein
MKTKKIISLIVVCTLSFGGFVRAQVRAKDVNSLAFDTSAYSPTIFLGLFTENANTTQISANVTEEKLELSGKIFESDSSRFLLGMRFSGTAENGVASLLSGTKVVPKASIGLAGTYTLRNWISTNAATDMKYNSLLKTTGVDHKRHNNISVTIGLKAEGAKYMLIDTGLAVRNMVSKKKYTGWEQHLQFNWLIYNYNSRLLWNHGLKFSYGQMNNVGDLNEYAISSSNNFQDSTFKQNFDLKKTGYYSSAYMIQHYGTISYEMGIYPTALDSRLPGFLIGTEMKYYSKQKNEFNGYLGATFLVRTSTDPAKPKPPIYISVVIQTTDPANWKDEKDFKLKDSFSGFLRFSRPLTWTSPENKKSKKEQELLQAAN